ncbi:GtrA family protein [Hamadaea sp. NPDC051192]|uniref:GtrA family protein n=1 Tax=Hamadaea sp. NPDC051192 TaxID=3154940 RepID=UPI00341B2C78
MTQTSPPMEAAPPAQERHPWIPAWLDDVPGVGRLAVTLLNDSRVRYLLAGGITAVISYAYFSVLFLLVGHHVHYLVTLTIANFLTTVTAYPIYQHGVYQAGQGGFAQFLRFYATCLWALVFGLVTMPLLVELVSVPVLLAQAIVIVVFPLINYPLQRRWAFGGGRR